MNENRSAESAIEELLADLTGRVGAGTVAQRRWALGELLRYTAHTLGRPEPAVTVGQLLDPYTVLAWLYEAENPQEVPLRRLGDPRRPAASPSQRARAASVRALATHLGTALPDLRMPKPAPRPLAPDPLLRTFAGRLAGPTPRGLLPDAWTRFTAIARLVLDTGAAEKDLAVLRITDLDLPAATLTMTLDGTRQPVRLPAATCHAMTNWLAVRDTLVARLTGSAPTALWVRVAATSIGRVTAAPGLPLSERGLRKHWSAVITALEPELDGADLSLQTVQLAVRARRATSAHPG